MQWNTIQNEVIIAVLVLVVLVLFINPFMLWMPDTLVYMMLAGLAILVALFAGLFWRERARDEREALHRHIAARVGYLLGVIGLLVGIVVETISTQNPSIWLVIALGIMVIGKLAGMAYSRKQH